MADWDRPFSRRGVGSLDRSQLRIYVSPPQTDTNIAFVVPEGHDAVYIGTITLETVFESGYYGLIEAIHDFDVSNDCLSDCADRLTQLQLSTDAAFVALMREESHLASAD